MRNIWIHEKKKGILGIVIAIVILYVFLFSMIAIINSRVVSNDSVQIEALESDIAKTINLCYSIEGQYPPSVEYMEDNYGFKYDKDKYFIHYESIGSNLTPNYKIFMVNNN